MPPNERNTIHLRGQNTDWPGLGCSVDVGFWKFKIQTYAAVVSVHISVPLLPSLEDLVPLPLIVCHSDLIAIHRSINPVGRHILEVPAAWLRIAVCSTRVCRAGWR